MQPLSCLLSLLCNPYNYIHSIEVTGIFVIIVLFLSLHSVVVCVCMCTYNLMRILLLVFYHTLGAVDYLLTLAFHRFSGAKKCTNEGRALMQLDYQQYRTKVEKISNIRFVLQKSAIYGIGTPML